MTENKEIKKCRLNGDSFFFCWKGHHGHKINLIAISELFTEQTYHQIFKKGKNNDDQISNKV